MKTAGHAACRSSTLQLGEWRAAVTICSRHFAPPHGRLWHIPTLRCDAAFRQQVGDKQTMSGRRSNGALDPLQPKLLANYTCDRLAIAALRVALEPLLLVDE